MVMIKINKYTFLDLDNFIVHVVVFNARIIVKFILSNMREVALMAYNRNTISRIYLDNHRLILFSQVVSNLNRQSLMFLILIDICFLINNYMPGFNQYFR